MRSEAGEPAIDPKPSSAAYELPPQSRRTRLTSNIGRNSLPPATVLVCAESPSVTPRPARSVRNLSFELSTSRLRYWAALRAVGS